MPKGLTDRQRKFVDAYAACRRGTEAAIAAGYGEKWAASAASRLLAQPEIAAAVKRRTQPASKPAAPVQTPLEYLIGVVNDIEATTARRLQAAIAAAPYVHARPDTGKKAEAAASAKRASTGKFAPCAPPRVVLLPVKPNPKD